MVSPLNVGVLLVVACVVGILLLSRLLLPWLLSFVVGGGGGDSLVLFFFYRGCRVGRFHTHFLFFKGDLTGRVFDVASRFVPPPPAPLLPTLSPPTPPLLL